MVAVVRAESVWMWTSKMLLRAPWHSHVPTHVASSVASDHRAGFLPQDLCMHHFFLLRVLFLHSVVSIKSVRHFHRGYAGGQDCGLMELMFYECMRVTVWRLKQIIQQKDNFAMIRTRKTIKQGCGRESDWIQRSMKPPLRRIFWGGAILNRGLNGAGRVNILGGSFQTERIARAKSHMW